LSILDVQSFRETDCDTHHFLVIAKVWERLVINKQETRNFHVEKFKLRKLSEQEFRKQYQIKIPKRFAA